MEGVKAYQVRAEKSIDGEKRMGTERTTYLIGPDRKDKSYPKKGEARRTCNARPSPHWVPDFLEVDRAASLIETVRQDDQKFW